jgi:uncharacterized metal-binding protein
MVKCEKWGKLCETCNQSCLNCDGVYKKFERKQKFNVNIQTFKPYFDVTMGKEVTSKHEINEYCKRNDMVYAGDKELTQQCAQNKKDTQIKQDRAFVEGLAERLGKVI